MNLHAELQAHPPDRTKSAESDIETQMVSIVSSAGNPQEGAAKLVALVNSTFEQLDIDMTTVILKKVNSIWCCFACTSEEQLETLRYHYESELLKDELEKIFNMLTDKKITILQLKWDSDEYNECRLRLKELIAFGR